MEEIPVQGEKTRKHHLSSQRDRNIVFMKQERM